MSADIISRFDVDNLDPCNTVVRCRTQEEADIFLEYLYLKGVRDAHGTERLRGLWKKYEGETCYHLSVPRWCHSGYYKETSNFTIVDFSEIYIGNEELEAASVVIGYDDLFS